MDLESQRSNNLAIRELPINTRLADEIVIDTTKDAVVIDGVSKVFKKEQSLFSRLRKESADKKKKKEVRAVDNVTLTVKRREIVGILAANASGKSTLIRILSTLLIPDTGHVSIFGY